MLGEDLKRMNNLHMMDTLASRMDNEDKYDDGVEYELPAEGLDWEEIARTMLCAGGDASEISFALQNYDNESTWFVLRG